MEGTKQLVLPADLQRRAIRGTASGDGGGEQLLRRRRGSLGFFSLMGLRLDSLDHRDDDDDEVLLLLILQVELWKLLSPQRLTVQQMSLYEVKLECIDPSPPYPLCSGLMSMGILALSMVITSCLALPTRSARYKCSGPFMVNSSYY